MIRLLMSEVFIKHKIFTRCFKMARKACLLVIARVCANANSWHSHKANSNFALWIATQGLFACDEQAFFKSACDDERAFCLFLIGNFKALRLEI